MTVRHANAFLILLLAAGCGSGSGSSPSTAGGLSVAGSTSITRATGAVTTSTNGTAPTASATVLTKNGPSITITAPTRGSFTTTPVTLVQGTVTDPSGVASLTIQGNVVIPAANGSFSEAVPLDPGLNIIVVEALNTLGLPSKASLALVEGTFAPDTQPITNALVGRLNQGTFDAVSRVIESKLGGPTLTQAIMAKNPLYMGSLAPLGFTIASAEVDATSCSFGQPTITLTPVAGALTVAGAIPQVDVVANAHDYGGIPFSITGHITADQATISANVAVTITNGVLATTISNVQVHLDNFGWGLNGFPSILTGLASPLVQSLIENEVAKEVTAIVPQEINKALGGLATPFQQTIMGAQASFDLTPTLAAFDPLGLSLQVDANVQMTQVAGYQPLPAPGSFVTSGGAPQNGAGPDFAISVNEDLLNRVGYEAWRSGIMEITVDAQTAPTLGLPAGITLDASFLETWIPELVGKLPASDPLAIVVSPKLPPIFRAKPAPDALEAGLGEVELSVYDVAQGGKQLIVSIAIHGRFQAQASLGPTNVITVSVGTAPTFDVSVLSSPIVPDIDRNGIDNFIQFTVPPMVQILANTWSGFPVPVYPGVTPSNVQMNADGAQKSFITVSGDL
jgi:hypothetical protein